MTRRPSGTGSQFTCTCTDHLESAVDQVYLSAFLYCCIRRIHSVHGGPVHTEGKDTKKLLIKYFFQKMPAGNGRNPFRRTNVRKGSGVNPGP